MSWFVLFAALAAVQASSSPRTYVWQPADLEASLKRVQSKDPTILPSLAVAVSEADAALNTPARSVMDKVPIPPSGSKHDYMSLDKYYWPCSAPPPNPDPKNSSVPCIEKLGCDSASGLPYIRCDGIVNPNMTLYDHDNLINMTTAVVSLGIGYYFTQNEQYADHAALLLTTWFLDEDTYMHPNMEFGHFIPGVANGSHGAMIDIHYWPVLLDATSLLYGSSNWTSEKDAALRTWMGDLCDWVILSPFGAAEFAETNNHGVWVDVLASGLALHSGKADVAALIARDAMVKRINLQITEDGELPAELARTKAFSYTEFATDAFFTLTYLAIASGVDLSHESGHGDSRLRTTVDWQLPYVTQQKPFPYSQIVPFFPSDGCTITAVDQCVGSYFSVYRRAANLYRSTTYEKVIATLPGTNATANVINLVNPSNLTSVLHE